MIKLIVGPKGSGKTKKIIDCANSVVDPEKNEIAFITDTTRYRLDIKHDIRFIDSSEYGCITDGNTLLAFLGGLLAGNGDIEAVYIDGIARIAKAELAGLSAFFEKAGELAKSQKTEFVFTISSEEKDLPEYLKKFEKIKA